MSVRDNRKKMILDFMSDKTYVPMKIKEIAILLQVSKEERPELDACIDELLSEGKIEINKRGKYSIAAGNEYEGVFTSHPDGYGFVTVEGKKEDYFVPKEDTLGAMHGDIVSIKLLRSGKGRRQEAEVKKIITHAINELVGTYEKSGKGFGFVVPDNVKITTDIFVDLKNDCGAEDGDKVVVKIDRYPANKSPEGTITEILGKVGEPFVDVTCIAKSYGLSGDFEDNLLAQAQRVAKPVSEADRKGRLDLRDVMMVTIDGEDTKDLDDAVSLSMDGENYVLGVHIADVTNYVQENSALDREALKRGTSVYLADRVIPMLPKSLSNGICSLNQNEDRLALSCIMKVDSTGKVVGHEIAETVINVNRKMTYTEVNSILTKNATDELIEECSGLIPMFEKMGELAKILRNNRFSKGSIDFDFPETKVILDEEGRPVEIKPYDRNVATKLIEDFMLLANKVVAETYFYMELPFVYRIHDVPNPEKIKELVHFISNFGYGIKGSFDEIHPKEIQKLLAKAEGSPNETMVATLALRAMSKAKYSTACSGHFGLAFSHYCHFTSPIRRYPDLQIHRIIKENLRGRLIDKRIEHYESILESVAKHSTDTEITAAEAERESIKLKKAEYMLDHIGESFDGVISSVKSWGMYIELPNTVEGMVHVSRIPGDYFDFIESEYAMIGQRTGKKYSLGQSVKIVVAAVDIYSRTIDFDLA